MQGRPTQEFQGLAVWYQVESIVRMAENLVFQSATLFDQSKTARSSGIMVQWTVCVSSTSLGRILFRVLKDKTMLALKTWPPLVIVIEQSTHLVYLNTAQNNIPV